MKYVSWMVCGYFQSQYPLSHYVGKANEVQAVGDLDVIYSAQGWRKGSCVDLYEKGVFELETIGDVKQRMSFVAA